MIKHIEIENFKKFKTVKFDLKNYTVLMGENGCGKTSILQAIALGLRILSSTDLIQYDTRTRIIKFRKKGVPYNQLPGFYLEDPTEIFYSKQARGGASGGVSPIKIEFIDGNDNKYKINITSLFGAFIAKGNTNSSDFNSYPSLIDCKPLFISGFVGIPAAEERLFPVAINDRLIRGRASDIIRNLLLNLKETSTDKFDRLSSKINKYYSFNLGKISYEQEKDLYVHANYIERLRSGELRLDLSSSGSGFLQILQILVPIYLFSTKSKVILLDEPDAHLHPNLQRLTAQVLAEIATEENIQIIISTHSTPIIREVDPETVLPVSNKKEYLQYLKSSSQLEDEIIQRIDNFISGKVSILGKLLFVEDQTISILQNLDKILETFIIDGLNSIPILHAAGKDDKVPFRIKAVLEEITNTSLKVYFIRDSDGLDEEWRRKLVEYSRSFDVDLFILKYHEMESYLINPRIINEILSENQIQISIDEISADLSSIMKDTISMSRYNFDSTLSDVIYKTAKLLNITEINYNNAQAESRRIREIYETYTDFELLRIVAPAKETLKEYFKLIKTRNQYQLTNTQILRKLKITDIDDDLAQFLKEIKQD